MHEKVHLGPIGHFGVAVGDPRKSARWWRERFDLEVMFEGDEYVGLANGDVMIVLHQGTPHPETMGHMSFHLSNMDALQRALDILKALKTNLEDPGDEIGPEEPGSSNMGLWFHDADGYRWELEVRAKR